MEYAFDIATESGVEFVLSYGSRYPPDLDRGKSDGLEGVLS